MKSIGVPNLNQYGTDKDIKCPYCGGHKHRPMYILSSINAVTRDGTGSIDGISHSSSIESYDENRIKDHIAGNIYFCLDCMELFFAYLTVDTRCCKDCKHHTTVHGGYACNEWCTWSQKRIQYLESRCSHLDEEKPVLPESAACMFCVHYNTKRVEDKQVEGGYVIQESCPHTDKDNYTFKTQKVTPCSEYAPSYQKYKKYREDWEKIGQLWDDSIHIPEFDKMITEERAVALLEKDKANEEKTNA